MAFWSAISRATGAVKEAVLDLPNEEPKDHTFATLNSTIKELEARCEEYQKLLNRQNAEAEEYRCMR